MNNEVLKAKEAVVSELKDKLSNSQTLVVFEYRGMNVQEITALRRALRAEGTEIGVYKNTLLERAAESLGNKDLLPHLDKPNSVRWQTLIRQAYYVPETKMIDDLLS